MHRPEVKFLFCILAPITSRRKEVSASKSKRQCSCWLIFLPRNASESGVSLTLFLIGSRRACNTTEGMQSSSKVWLPWALCQLGGRLSHSYRKCWIYQRTNGLQNLGKRSLPEQILLNTGYLLPSTATSVEFSVCSGCAPSHSSSDRLGAVKLLDGIWCNFESLVQAVFAEHIPCFPYITYIGHLQSKSQEWLQLQ